MNWRFYTSHNVYYVHTKIQLAIASLARLRNPDMIKRLQSPEPALSQVHYGRDWIAAYALSA